MELLNKVAEFFVGNEYRLLIIDSIMALFRVDYTGRGELNERQQKLNQFLSKLTHVAEGTSKDDGERQEHRLALLILWRASLDLKWHHLVDM